MSLNIDLSGRKALVTGVSSGIGAAIASTLAQAGCDVAGCGNRSEAEAGAQAFLNAVREQGRKAHYQQVNLATESGPAEFVAFAAQALGGLDILVSNAGRNVFADAEHCAESDWQRNLDLNLASHWRLAKLCKPHLEAGGHGVVQIMTSNHAFATIPGCFPYNIAKTALTGLVRALAIEWGPKIRAVGIAPGFVETPGNDTWFASFPDPEAERQRTIAMHPAGKLGACDDIGAWSAFLASDFAAFATGSTYVIDGGRLALLQDS